VDAVQAHDREQSASSSFGHGRESSNSESSSNPMPPVSSMVLNIATCFRCVFSSGCGGNVGRERVELCRRNGRVVRGRRDSVVVGRMSIEGRGVTGPLAIEPTYKAAAGAWTTHAMHQTRSTPARGATACSSLSQSVPKTTCALKTLGVVIQMRDDLVACIVL